MKKKPQLLVSRPRRFTPEIGEPYYVAPITLDGVVVFDCHTELGHCHEYGEKDYPKFHEILSVPYDKRVSAGECARRILREIQQGERELEHA